MIVWTTNQIDDAAGQQAGESVLRRQRDLHAGVRQDQEPAEHGDDTDHPQLLGDDGEDEVAVCERQEVAELVLALADAFSGQASLRQRDHRLVGLVAEVVLVRGDVEERGEPGLAARAGDDEGERADSTHARPPPPSAATVRRR